MTVYEKKGGERTKPKVYFESSIVIGLDRGQTEPEEEAAVFRIIELWHEGRIDLVTSSVVLDEISRIPPEKSRSQTTIYRILKKIPRVEEQILRPPILLGSLSNLRRPGIPRLGSGKSTGPVVVKDGDFAYLETLLRDLPDASHVFQAFKNGIDYLVTRDVKTILVHAAEIEPRFGVRVLLPLALVTELEGEAAEPGNPTPTSASSHAERSG
jgi:hypothetical protein